MVLLLAIGSLNFSCSKDNTSNQTNSDFYYVKYIISSTTIYSGGKINLIFKNEKNKDTTLAVNQNAKSEIIIGPVSKGFIAHLTAYAYGSTNGQLKLNAEIDVSKNNSVFALKGINSLDTPRDQVDLSYTIDY